MLDTLISRL